MLPKGNPLRWKRGGITALVGGLGAFLLMAHNAQLRFGVPLGFLFMIVATWGVLDFVRLLRRRRRARGSRRHAAGRSRAPRRRAARVSSSALRSWAARAASLQQWIWGALVTLTFELLVAAVFNLGVKLGPWAKDETRPRAPALAAPRLLARAIARAPLLPGARAATRSGIRGRRTTARSRARSSRATTGSRSGGRRTAGSGRSRS